MEDLDFYRTSTHFIAFYTTKNNYIELLHTYAFSESPSKGAVCSLIERATEDPMLVGTYGLEYKVDFSVVELQVDASEIQSTDELTLLIIDKLIDNAGNLGVDLTSELFG